MRQRVLSIARVYLYVAVGCAAFAIYVSLLPFEFDRVSLASAWGEFRSSVLTLEPSRVSRPDVLANVLLFIPLGYSLAGSILVDRAVTLSRLLATPILVVVATVGLSLAVEFLQTFASGRVPSNIDVGAHALGGVIGVAIWLAVGNTLTTWVHDTVAAAPEDRLSRVLTGFAAAWLFVNLAPFDVTVDLGDLAERFRSGRISLTPFTEADLSPARRVWDAIAETAAAVPLGLLGVVGWTQRRRSVTAGIVFGMALVVAMEAAQLFIRSHAAHATDAIFGALGVIVGAWLGPRFFSRPLIYEHAPPPIAISLPATTLVVLWSVVLCLYHWLPYDFAVDPEAIRGKLAGMSLLPFAGYRAGSYLNAFNDLLLKLSLSLPLGVLGAFVLRSRPRVPRLVTTAAAVSAACFFSVIEAGQFFLPSRVPDPTDVLVGVTGTCLGLSLGRWLRGGGATVAGELNR